MDWKLALKYSKAKKNCGLYLIISYVNFWYSYEYPLLWFILNLKVKTLIPYSTLLYGYWNFTESPSIAWDSTNA